MSASWKGYYINLDRAADRRALIEAELRNANLRFAYSRFRAVDGIKVDGLNSPLKPGEIGCFRSHEGVLSREPSGWIHILEDDAILSAHLRPVVENLIDSGNLQAFDLVFTDVIIAEPHIATLRNLKRAYDQAMATAPTIRFGVIDLRNSNFAGTNSYFINPSSLTKVRSLLQSELARGPSMPIDLVYRRAVQDQRIRAGCIFPFVTGVRLSTDSTIAIRDPSEEGFLINDLLRSVFAADYDATKIAAALASLRTADRQDRQLDLLSAILRAMVAG